MSDPSPRPTAALELAPRERLGLHLGRAAAVLSSAMWAFLILGFVAVVIEARSGSVRSAIAVVGIIALALPVALLFAMSLRGVVVLARGPHVGIAMQLAVTHVVLALAIVSLTWLEIGMLAALVPLVIAALATTSARLTWRFRRSR